MLRGSVIRMHMHAVVKSALHNQFSSCMRYVSPVYYSLLCLYCRVTCARGSNIVVS